jgi:hypothetical protein
MTPPDELRIRVEATFPGAIVEQDLRRGDWCIVPAAPVEIDGLLVREINCDDRGRVGAHRIALTPSAIESVGRGRLLAREVLEQRMQSVSAHDLIAARRRLGL